jgi:hypothetical protein
LLLRRMPMLPSGKPDREALRARAAAQTRHPGHKEEHR